MFWSTLTCSVTGKPDLPWLLIFCSTIFLRQLVSEPARLFQSSSHPAIIYLSFLPGFHPSFSKVSSKLYLKLDRTRIYVEWNSRRDYRPHHVQDPPICRPRSDVSFVSIFDINTHLDLPSLRLLARDSLVYFVLMFCGSPPPPNWHYHPYPFIPAVLFANLMISRFGKDFLGALLIG